MTVNAFVEVVTLNTMESIVASKTKGLFAAYDKFEKTWHAYKNDSSQDQEREFGTMKQAQRWLRLGGCHYCGKDLPDVPTKVADDYFCSIDCLKDSLNPNLSKFEGSCW